MEKDNHDIDLKQRKKEINKIESYIKKAKNYEEQLITLKINYFNDFFTKERPLYEKLTDIPSSSYLNEDINLMAQYSIFNLEEFGKILVDYIANSFHSKAKSKIKIITTKELMPARKLETEDYDYQFYWYNQKTPHLFIQSSNISFDIPFNLANQYGEKTIKCLHNDLTKEYYYYGYYNQLINYYSKYQEISFNYQNNQLIRELIYNLAYYQKQTNETYLSEGKLLKAYKKIYKR